MKRHRTVAASPVRSATEAWNVVAKLITDTLERSPELDIGNLARELALLDGVIPAFIAAGHLEQNGLVLCDIGLHLTIYVATADSALEVDENLNPVPGGTNATNGWSLHIPKPGAADAHIVAVTRKSTHFSVDQPPASVPLKNNIDRTASTLISLSNLREKKW